MGKPGPAALVAFARETWRNDGAEGETAHALCDAVEHLEEQLTEAHRQRDAALADLRLSLDQEHAVRRELALAQEEAAYQRGLVEHAGEQVAKLEKERDRFRHLWDLDFDEVIELRDQVERLKRVTCRTCRAAEPHDCGCEYETNFMCGPHRDARRAENKLDGIRHLLAGADTRTMHGLVEDLKAVLGETR